MTDPVEEKEVSIEEILSSIRTTISSDSDEKDIVGDGSGETSNVSVDVPSIPEGDGTSKLYENPPGEPSSDDDVLELTDIIDEGSADGGLTPDRIGCPAGQRNESTTDILGVTVGELVEQSIHPLVLTWLNANIPPMVQKFVKEELKRLAQESDQS